MKLKDVSPETDELRKIIISSSLSSCYILLEEILAAKRGETFFRQIPDSLDRYF